MEDVDWIHLSQGRDNLLAVMDMVMNFVFFGLCIIVIAEE